MVGDRRQLILAFLRLAIQGFDIVQNVADVDEPGANFRVASP